MKRSILLIIAIFLSSPAFAVDLDEIQIHGFASQGFLKSNVNDYYFASTEEGTFEFNEFGLNVSTNLSAGLRVGIQLFARDLGRYGNDEVTVDWAFAEYRYRDWLGFRAGKIKNPPGLYSQSRDVDAARTFIFLPQSIYNEIFRATVTTKGFNVFGYTPFGVNYELLYGDDPVPLNSAEVEFMNRGFQTQVMAIQAKPVFFARALWTPPNLKGLRIGGSFANFKYDITTPNLGEVEANTDRPVFLCEFSTANLVASLEYRISYIDYEILANGQNLSQEDELYYAALTYRFNDWLEIGGYYSVSYGNRDDKDGDNIVAGGLPAALAWMKDTALSIRLDVTDNLLIKLEGHYLDGLSQVQYNPLDPDDTGVLFASKITTFF